MPWPRASQQTTGTAKLILELSKRTWLIEQVLVTAAVLPMAAAKAGTGQSVNKHV